MIKTVLRQLRPMLINDPVEVKILELGKQTVIPPEQAWVIIRELPIDHYQTLMYILTTIWHISRVEANRMTVNALLRVFTPNFMCFK